MASFHAFTPAGCLLWDALSLQVDHVHDIFAIFQVIGLVTGPLLLQYSKKRDSERDHARLEIILTSHRHGGRAPT